MPVLCLFCRQRTVVFRTANAYLTSTFTPASPSCSLFSCHFTPHNSFTWKGNSIFFFFFVCSRYLEWMHGHSVNDMSCVAAELRRKHLEQLLFPLVFKKITVELHNSQNGMACLLTGWNLQNRYSSWKHPTFPVMNVKTCVNRKADVNWLWKILSNLSVTGFDRCLKKETNLLFLLQATMAWGS